MKDGKFEYILEYIEYLKKKKNVSDATQSAYKTDLKKFFVFISEKYSITDFNDINQTVLLSYLLDQKVCGKATSSISRSMSVIKNFLLFAFHENLIDTNLSDVKLEIPKEKKKLPSTLTVEEVNILLSQPDESILGIRDKAMLETLYTSGLKVNELINLKVDDLNLKLKVLRCTSKTNTRVLPLGAIAQEAIEKYLTNSRCDISKTNSEYLFLSYSGENMSRQGFWKIVKKYVTSAGIKKNITTSTFRHSFASHMIQNGIHKDVLKDTLGNSSVASVQMYLDINRKRQQSS